MTRKYAIGHVHFLVDRLHVSTRDFTIARDIVKRVRHIPRGGKDSPVWPRAQINMAIADALARHKSNKELYLDVVNARI